jgi:phage head maturation protease
MISTDRQYRAFDFEQSEEMRVTGVPVVFNSPTVLYRIDGIDFKEVIDRHAFDDVDLSIPGKPPQRRKTERFN